MRPSLRRACPAKVNLFLKVVGRRSDGYHDLVTVMQPLSLADELTLTLTSGEISLECNNPELPLDGRNLAVKAARAFLTEAPQDFGVHIRLIKNIPLAAGLGGGSSDAAGVLLGLNDLTGHPLTAAALHRLASGLGADVPFFLLAGPAVGRGIGDQLTPLRLPPFWYVLINPGYPVSTAWVYGNLKLDLVEGLGDNITGTIFSQPPGTWLHNDLELVTLARHPDLALRKELLQQSGALATLMSGSGPTIFGIFASFAEAQGAAQKLRSSYQEWIMVTQGIPDDHTVFDL
jgi:4-diphosphocytidyl-2-C-methyl-D-erythritol kinase